MTFTINSEYFNNENNICFRIIKANKKSLHFEVLHFTSSVTRIGYKNVKINFGSVYKWISFYYEGHRYIFNENDFTHEYDIKRIRNDNPIFNNQKLSEYYL